jgi:hypothetical protein
VASVPIDDGDASARGSATSGTEPRDGGASDAGQRRSDAGDGGACVESPVIGAPCAPADVACNPGDACCEGRIQCDKTTGRWVRIEANCLCRPDAGVDAGSFACGPQTCSSRDYCEVMMGGPPPPPDAGPSIWHTCRPMPSQCATNASCACLQKWGSGCVTGCAEEDGHVVAHCAAP